MKEKLDLCQVHVRAKVIPIMQAKESITCQMDCSFLVEQPICNWTPIFNKRKRNHRGDILCSFPLLNYKHFRRICLAIESYDSCMGEWCLQYIVQTWNNDCDIMGESRLQNMALVNTEKEATNNVTLPTKKGSLRLSWTQNTDNSVHNAHQKLQRRENDKEKHTQLAKTQDWEEKDKKRKTGNIRQLHRIMIQSFINTVKASAFIGQKYRSHQSSKACSGTESDRQTGL